MNLNFREEQNVQQLVAKMAAWKTVLQSALPCMLILFWGSWSDRHSRRKPCMLLPVVGEFLAAIGLILCTYIDSAPMEACGITEALFPGLTGEIKLLLNILILLISIDRCCRGMVHHVYGNI